MLRFLATFVALAAFASTAVAQGRDYDLRDFTRIEVADGVVAEIIAGADFAVRAEARRGDLDRLSLTVSDETLRIGRLPEVANDRFVVRVSLPVLAGVVARAGSDVQAKGDEIALRDALAASGATLTVDGVSGADLVLSAVSGATLRISGTCDALRADAASGATLDARGLICLTGALDASNGATLRAHLTEAVDATAASGATIRVTGDPPDVEAELSTGGTVRQD